MLRPTALFLPILKVPQSVAAMPLLASSKTSPGYSMMPWRQVMMKAQPHLGWVYSIIGPTKNKGGHLQRWPVFVQGKKKRKMQICKATRKNMLLRNTLCAVNTNHTMKKQPTTHYLSGIASLQGVQKRE